MVLMPQSDKATTALAQLRQSLVAQGASREEMLIELRRMREAEEE